MNSDQPFQIAYDQLESNDFIAAREAYRNAAATVEPNDEQLANLGIAESEEALQFRRAMCARYPQSLPCRLALIQALQSAGHASHAILAATECLTTFQYDDRDQARIRFVRLQSAITSGKSDTILEDFSTLWSKAAINGRTSRLCLGLLNCLAAIRNPAFIATIDKLASLPFIDDESRHFLVCKTQELRILKKLRENLRSTDVPSNGGE